MVFIITAVIVAMIARSIVTLDSHRRLQRRRADAGCIDARTLRDIGLSDSQMFIARHGEFDE